MLLVLFSLALIIISLQGIQVDFERFDQLSGYNFYNSSLRVRKYNRTMVTLNGTLAVVATLNRSMVISTDFFHSSRGNQQFNHYPVKLPTQDVCDFMQNFYADYREYVEDMVNMPEEGECPIAPRTIYVTNKIFPTKAIPPFFPPGLWKVFIINSLNNVEMVRFEIIAKFDFERTEQLSGFDVFASTLRVRKYNRTTIVLNGTFASKIVLNNSYRVSTDLFHSPLGNQQFNHYPMKLPAQQLCDFMDSLRDEYGPYLTKVYNLPERGTCPIHPREVHTIDKIFPTEVIPPFLPKGLWKVYILTWLGDVEVSRFEWIVKASTDFGIEVIFESIEQLSGFDIINSTLRVRKFNATTSVLNGSLFSNVSFNNSHKSLFRKTQQVATIVFHSSLGNQQFNFYPMKLPPAPACYSRDMFYDEYKQYLTNVYNLPKKGTCPIGPREIIIIDKVFPSDAVPPFLPNGLWKVLVVVTFHDVEISRFVLICKVTGFFR
uniref:Glycosyltransferase family 92 protein n=1 Tax=Anopheles minimus TaxID=112268 RepID=A0A182WGA5_9DIPT